MIGQVKTIDGQKIVVPISGSIPTGNPVGTLLSRANGQVPRNYLECDGSTFNAGQYPALYLYLGTNVLPERFDHTKLGDIEEITIGTSSATATTMPYDGVIDMYMLTDYTAQNVYVNGVLIQQFKANYGSTATYIGTSFEVKKGDVVYVTGTTVKKYARWYKHHLYIKAVDGVDISDEDTFLVTVKNFIEEKNSYSTTEMLTGGKWIDGKPIYRKVLEFNSETTLAEGGTNFTLATLGLSDIDNIFNIYAFNTTGSKTTKRRFSNIPFYWYSDTTLQLRAPTSITGYFLGLIIEYTKTTD